MDTRNLSDVVVLPNSTIGSVIELINKNGLRGVFVCDEERELLGIVMDAEIRRASLSNLDLNASVKTIMKTSPFVIHHSCTLDQKKELLIKSGKILAPIIDDTRRVVGYVYLSDIIDEIFLKSVLKIVDYSASEDFDHRRCRIHWLRTYKQGSEARIQSSCARHIALR